MTTTPTAPRLRAAMPTAVRKDNTLTSPASIAIARDALAQLAGPEDIGDYAGAVMEAERLATLCFVCLRRGYVGWYWAVTIARPARGRTATVCETELLPGPDALLPPAWVPWSQRLRPGDLGPGDVLPYVSHDDRLDQGFEAVDPDADQLAEFELGLGRARVLSAVGRAEAAARWYAGEHGPKAPEAVRSALPCSTCGFLVQLRGSLGAMFGVCANEWSPSDGSVVSYDHGCGAHSQSDAEHPASEWPAPQSWATEMDVEPVEITEVGQPATDGAAGDQVAERAE